jgi:hypothetical protein
LHPCEYTLQNVRSVESWSLFILTKSVSIPTVVMKEQDPSRKQAVERSLSY